MTVKSTLTLRDLVDHISKNLDALQKPENYLGLWRDPQTGQVYYDISRRFEPGQVRKATKFGESTIQKAAYDIDASKDLPVGNVYQFVQTPEYQQRLEDMYRAGIEAHGTGSWWPLKGGPIERVYGPEATPQMSGFLASMSGQLSPEDNLRYATEYRRRMIRGEPVIQQDFRVPETAVKFRPGGQMFGEATKTANLTKSAEARSLADLQKIQLDKQHDMARSLMGETDVAVLDRRFAKLSEAPKRGIYVDVEPDTIPGAMTQKSPTPYPHMENALRTAAKQRGMTLADYSAIVWEGIGSTIKRTGELYGTKYRAGAIPEPSGGFRLDEHRWKRLSFLQGIPHQCGPPEGHHGRPGRQYHHGKAGSHS